MRWGWGQWFVGVGYAVTESHIVFGCPGLCVMCGVAREQVGACALREVTMMPVHFHREVGGGLESQVKITGKSQCVRCPHKHQCKFKEGNKNGFVCPSCLCLPWVYNLLLLSVIFLFWQAVFWGTLLHSKQCWLAYSYLCSGLPPQRSYRLMYWKRGGRAW